jgi:hypothetical protein
VKHEAQTVAEALGLVREGVGATFVKESDLALVGAGLISVQLDTKVHVETGLIYVRELRWDSLRTFIATVAKQFRLQGTSGGQKHGAKDGIRADGAGYDH